MILTHWRSFLYVQCGEVPQIRMFRLPVKFLMPLLCHIQIKIITTFKCFYSSENHNYWRWKKTKAFCIVWYKKCSTYYLKLIQYIGFFSWFQQEVLTEFWKSWVCYYYSGNGVDCFMTKYRLEPFYLLSIDVLMASKILFLLILFHMMSLL